MNEFTENLKQNLESFEKVMSYDDLDEYTRLSCSKVEKTSEGKSGSFFSKPLFKAIMHRSKLKNRYNKNPNENNKKI